MILASHRQNIIRFLAFFVVISAFLSLLKNENTLSARLLKTTHRYKIQSKSRPNLLIDFECSLLRSSSTPDSSEAFAKLYRPIKLSPTHPVYRDAHGHEIPGAPADKAVWTKPFGKKLLVVDIDTRVPNGENQIFNTEQKINWEKLVYGGDELVSGGISNHYLYAKIHGYDYLHYEALVMKDVHQTWVRPHVFLELLSDYQFVVAFDADAVVSHLEIPFEWMFNRWEITKNTMVAMPHDTEEYRDGKPISLDSTGLPVLNAGFVILQNHRLTFDLLSAWANCPTEERYKGCAEWKTNWSHEQRAFSEYIRHDPEFNVSADSIVGVPCDDAMGWPGAKESLEKAGNKGISDCSGQLIRHYTLAKHDMKEASANIIMQSLMEIIQKNINQDKAATYRKEHDPTKVGEKDQGTG